MIVTQKPCLYGQFWAVKTPLGPEHDDIYCDIVFGANIGGFEAYCCIGVTLWGEIWNKISLVSHWWYKTFLKYFVLILLVYLEVPVY